MSLSHFRKRVLATAGMLVLMLLPAVSADAQLQSRRNGQASDLPINFGFQGPKVPTRGFVPRHELRVNRSVRQSTTTVASESRVPGRLVSIQEEVAPQATDDPMTIVEPMEVESIHVEPGHDFFDHGCASCGTEVGCGTEWTGTCHDCAGACGGCGSYGTCGPRGCLLPCPQLSLKSMEFFGGVQAFKGQPNLGADGSFGFNFGLNWGFRLPCLHNDFFTGQFGVRGVSSNFQNSLLTFENRDQLFVTTGLVRRVDYGLQGGIVADVLYDRWYYENTVAQLRGGLSWVYQGGSEFGFQFASSIQNADTVAVITLPPPNVPLQINAKTEALGQYRFFYGYPLSPGCDDGARATWSIGGSSEGDTILGSDFWLPVANNWGLTTTVTYLIPKSANTTGVTGSINEAWNIGINLTWYPIGNQAYRKRYTRPLFDVADNGSFLINRF